MTKEVDMQELIRMTDIKKVYKKAGSTLEAIKKSDLSIYEHDMVAIMGESGSGKSTLLNIIGLLDVQTEGEYLLLGKNTKDYKERQKAKLRNELFGFVLQDFALVDQYTVYENVEIPFLYSSKFKGLTKDQKEEKIKKILEKLGIADKIHEKCTNLSGGQRQRVSIARALVIESKVIIADEPTGALDEKTAEEIMALLRQVNIEFGVSIVIVTHDRKVAESCDKIYYMDKGCLKAEN